MADAEEQSTPAPKAGRNLPAAIGVGVLMGAVLLATLFTVRWAFVGLVALAVMVAVFEVSRALGGVLPRLPLVAGSVVVVVATYVGGTSAMVVAALLFVVALVVVLAVAVGPERLPEIAASVFVACYVAFLASFAVLLAVPDDGPRRVVALVATVACSDTFGYVVGVFLGKHRMAPSVSPKKSWEGFGGSVVACCVCGGLLLPLTLHGTWWQGVVFGLAIVVAATLGDLGESMLKRDLGIKDMGHLLPGHGGVMDRLDAMLFAAPVAWALLTAFIAWPS